MEMVNIEKYLQGSKEIERRRQVISRIICTVVKKAQEHCAEHHEITVIVRVSLAPFGEFIITTGDSSWSQRAMNPKRVLRATFEHTEWTLSPDAAESLPLDAVLVVYAKLNEIVTAIDAAVPAAGIAALFNKIASIAE